MKSKKILAVILAAAAMTACSSGGTSSGETTAAETAAADTTVSETASEEVTAEETEAETSSEETEKASADGIKTVRDREGGTVEVGEINTIVSGAPSVSEILTGLGLGDKIVAADQYSADVEGIDPAVCTLDFYNLDIEAITAMAPDAVIINGISMTGADDPYSALKEAGVTVLYVPSSESIDSVKDDIRFLAECTGTEAKGDELVKSIDDCVAEIKALADTITDRKSVYFEVSAAPYMYTCGADTFSDDILDLIGAENIYGSESGWLSNSDESVIAADPDVIVTSVMYDGYDYNEIYSREGWENISAIVNKQVYQVEPNPVSRPSQNVVDGIRLLAETIYPEVYGTASENTAA